MSSLPAEGEDLPHEVSRPHCRFKYILKASLYLRAVGDIIHRHLGEANDGGEHVVKIVGNAPREGAEGFHFLSLAELGLQKALVCDIMAGRYV